MVLGIFKKRKRRNLENEIVELEVRKKDIKSRIKQTKDERERAKLRLKLKELSLRERELKKIHVKIAREEAKRARKKYERRSIFDRLSKGLEKILTEENKSRGQKSSSSIFDLDDWDFDIFEDRGKRKKKDSIEELLGW